MGILIVFPFLWFYSYVFFFFNDTATTEIYTLSLHDALPISFTSALNRATNMPCLIGIEMFISAMFPGRHRWIADRSEEHTSELQSHLNIVCRLLLEKKKRQCVKIFSNS